MMIEREKMYFVDEFGVTITSRSNYGRSVKGSKAYKKVKQIRSRNYSIAAVMNQNSILLFQIQDNAYNSEDYTDFMAQLFHHFTENGILGAHLIMDNVPFHKAERVMQLIETNGHHPVFLPPYSPFLNPIEELFSKWKNDIRRSESQNEDELYETVHNTSDNITAQNCANWVRHMESYLPKCLNRDEIYS
jgi:transposase